METMLAGHRLDPARPGTGYDADGAPVHLARRRPGPAVDDEVAALLAAAGPHVARLLDVATAPGGDVVLVGEHLPHRLVDLLAVPGWPAPGEAVTVLVPIAQAVASLGDARVRHGAVAPGAVRFDDDGRPVLTRFAGAAPVGPLDDPTADAAALRALAAALLLRCGADGTARRIAADAPSPLALAELLFDLADPVPVRLQPEPAAPRTGPPARLVDVQPAGAAEDGAGPVPRMQRAARSGALSVRAGADAARQRIRGVRGRVWAVAGTSAALLAAALVLLPAHVDRGAAAAPDAAGARVDVHRAPSASAAASGPSASPAVQQDPAAAVAALVEERAACLQRADAACLARVESTDSPLAADDAAAVRAGAEAAPTPSGRARLLRRSGSTAVVQVGDAVLLAVLQPDGWRLRDLAG